MNKWTAIGFLFLGTVASSKIALSGDVNKYELGALANYYFPPIFGALTILVFILIDWINKRIRIPLTIILFLINIAFAFYIR